MEGWSHDIASALISKDHYISESFTLFSSLYILFHKVSNIELRLLCLVSVPGRSGTRRMLSLSMRRIEVGRPYKAPHHPPRPPSRVSSLGSLGRPKYRCPQAPSVCRSPRPGGIQGVSQKYPPFADEPQFPYWPARRSAGRSEEASHVYVPVLQRLLTQ